MIKNKRFFYSALLWLCGFVIFDPFIWHSIIHLVLSSYQASFIILVLGIDDLMMFMSAQFRKLLVVFNLFLVLLVPGVFSLAIPPNLSIFSAYKNRSAMSALFTLQCCEEWLNQFVKWLGKRSKDRRCIYITGWWEITVVESKGSGCSLLGFEYHFFPIIQDSFFWFWTIPQVKKLFSEFKFISL